MNKLPANAGMIRLTTQIDAAAVTTPITFFVSSPNNWMLISPLTPRSAIGIVGTIANIKNNTNVVHTASSQ